MSSLPLPQVVFKKTDLDDPNLAFFNLQFGNLTQAINNILGHAGVPVFRSKLNLNLNQIQNLGDPINPRDAVSKAYADANYGAAAIRPQLEVLGNAILQSMRRLNDPNQQEQASSFLNTLMSTTPTTNTSVVSFGVPGGGTVSVTIAGGIHQRVDGSTRPYSAFNDTVTLPTSYNIATLARASSIVTVATTPVHPFNPGDNVAIGGGNALSDFSFVGTFQITTVPDNHHFKYQQFAPDASATGGVASLGGVYYYHLQAGSGVLSRAGPFTTDTWSNRLSASTDGQTIIAVAVVNGFGGDLTQSAAGATPPSVNNGVRLFGRL